MAPLQAGARGPIAPAIAPNTLRFGGASRALPCFSPSGEPLSPSASSPLKSLGGNPVRVRNPGPGTEASRDPSAVSGLVRPAICTTTGTKKRRRLPAEAQTRQAAIGKTSKNMPTQQRAERTRVRRGTERPAQNVIERGSKRCIGFTGRLPNNAPIHWRIGSYARA